MVDIKSLQGICKMFRSCFSSRKQGTVYKMMGACQRATSPKQKGFWFPTLNRLSDKHQNLNINKNAKLISCIHGDLNKWLNAYIEEKTHSFDTEEFQDIDSRAKAFLRHCAWSTDSNRKKENMVPSNFM